MNLVVQPVMKAGDVIFFIDGGLTHGATAWKNPLPRRGVLMKYRYTACLDCCAIGPDSIAFDCFSARSGRDVHRGGGDLVHPAAR